MLCLYARVSQEGRDELEDLGVRLQRVVKAGRVYQCHATTKEFECVRRLHLWRARAQSFADLELRPADEVDELTCVVSSLWCSK